MRTIDGGRERGAFQVEKWDTDQIGWTVKRDYDDARLIRPGQEPIGPSVLQVRLPAIRDPPRL